MNKVIKETKKVVELEPKIRKKSHNYEKDKDDYDLSM